MYCSEVCTGSLLGGEPAGSRPKAVSSLSVQAVQVICKGSAAAQYPHPVLEGIPLVLLVLLCLFLSASWDGRARSAW